MTELDFTLKLKETTVTIDGKSYKLKELTGEQRDKYLSTFDLEMELIDGKAQVKTGTSFKSFSTVSFLAMCLYDENDNLVPKATLAKWPASAISNLHSIAQSLSGLDEKSENKEKND